MSPAPSPTTTAPSTGSSAAATSATRVLLPEQWAAAADAHAARALDLTGAARERRARGFKHPVEDFLYEYYAIRPGALDRWEPGLGVALAAPAADSRHREAWEAHATRRWTVVRDMADDAVDHISTGTSAGSTGERAATPGTTAAVLDVDAYLADRRPGVEAMDRILRATAGREAALGCLGLHEWAMVYRQERHRHPLPLRLGQEGTDAVVDASTIRCTHFDAFRFFTAPAVPLNRLQPTRESQAALEQPGCLHANMDLLRWAWKLGPAVPGELLLDCFALAKDVRVLDMEASPYDCRDLGYGVVPIETAQGRATYIDRQREFSERAAPLRARLLGITGALLGRA